MRRLVWFALGAASATWALRRGEAFLEQVRSRGVSGNVKWIVRRSAAWVDQAVKGER